MPTEAETFVASTAAVAAAVTSSPVEDARAVVVAAVVAAVAVELCWWWWQQQQETLSPAVSEALLGRQRPCDRRLRHVWRGHFPGHSLLQLRVPALLTRRHHYF